MNVLMKKYPYLNSIFYFVAVMSFLFSTSTVSAASAESYAVGIKNTCLITPGIPWDLPTANQLARHGGDPDLVAALGVPKTVDPTVGGNRLNIVTIWYPVNHEDVLGKERGTFADIWGPPSLDNARVTAHNLIQVPSYTDRMIHPFFFAPTPVTHFPNLTSLVDANNYVQTIFGPELDLIHTKMNSYYEAPLAVDKGPFPLVVMLNGLVSQRDRLPRLAESIASNGYIVMSIDHTGDTWGGTAFNLICPGELAANKPNLLNSVPFPPATDPFGGQVFLEPSLGMYYSNIAATGILEDFANINDIFIDILIQRTLDTGSLILQADTLIGISGAIDDHKIGVVGHSFGGYTSEFVISSFVPFAIPEPFLSALQKIDTSVSLAGGLPFEGIPFPLPITIDKPVMYIQSDDDEIVHNIQLLSVQLFGTPFPSVNDPLPLITKSYERVLPGLKKLLVKVTRFSHEDSWSNPFMECILAGNNEGPYGPICANLRTDIRWDIIPKSPFLDVMDPNVDVYQGRSVTFRRQLLNGYVTNWLNNVLKGNVNDHRLLKPNFDGRGVNTQFDGF